VLKFKRKFRRQRVNNSPVRESKSLTITGFSVEIVHLTSIESSAIDKWTGDHPIP
jgi:hypothetical protein